MVELFMAASSNGAKQSPQEKEVVTWLLSSVGKGHGAIHYHMEVRLIENTKG